MNKCIKVCPFRVNSISYNLKTVSEFAPCLKIICPAFDLKKGEDGSRIERCLRLEPPKEG